MILCAGNKENLKYFTSKDYQSSVLNKLWNNLIDFKIEKIGGTQNTLTDAMGFCGSGYFKLKISAATEPYGVSQRVFLVPPIFSILKSIKLF